MFQIFHCIRIKLFMKHIQKYLIPKGAILSKSLKKVSDHRSYVQPGSTTHLLVLSVFGMIYLYTLGYWPSRLNSTQKTAQVELPFSLRKSRGNLLVFPLSAPQIANFKNNLLGTTRASSIHCKKQISPAVPGRMVSVWQTGKLIPDYSSCRQNMTFSYRSTAILHNHSSALSLCFLSLHYKGLKKHEDVFLHQCRIIFNRKNPDVNLFQLHLSNVLRCNNHCCDRLGRLKTLNTRLV